MLTCHNLTYSYNHSDKGICDVNFSTDKGQIIGVIGENGAGKSTLFRCLLGLLKPTEGSIYFKNQPMDYSKKSLVEVRKHINMVLQDPERQIFYNTVAEEVAMGPKNLGLNSEKINQITARCIEAVDAQSFKEVPIQYLSFGQKKRVAIAGILALNCEIILMDEPETGLDPKMRNELVRLIQQLSQEGKIIIISSHNMDLIHHLCDYVYVFHEGRVLAEGHPSNVMNDAETMQRAHLQVPIILQISQKFGIELELMNHHFSQTGY